MTDGRPSQVALPGLDPAGACSSPGPQGPSAPSHGSPTAQQPIEATSRRLREALTKPYQPHDADIPCLLGKLSSDAKDPESAREALGKLWQLTVMTRANRAANQAAVAAEGGVAAVVEVATARLAAWEQGGADGDADSVIMALLVLENLSCNPALHRDMAHHPRLLPFLLRHVLPGAAAGEQQQHKRARTMPMQANAAKVLVNMTYSSPALQRHVAEAGGLEAGRALLRATNADGKPEVDLVRQGVWLLSHLTAGQGGTARGALAGRPEVLSSIKDLLQPATDPTTRVRAAELLCNLARGGTPSAPSYPASPPLATVLRQAGFVPVLLGLADPALVRRAPPEVVAPALLALAAMALGDVEAAREALGAECLRGHLAGVLEYSTLITRDYDMSRTLAAAHTLVCALAAAAVRNGLPLPPPANGSGTPQDAAEEAQWTPEVAEVVKASRYVSFPAALRLLGLPRPAYSAANLGKETGSGPHSFVANATYQVNVELLPLLRHDNARMVANACARLYQIAVCLTDHPEGRAVLTNASLVVALVDLLASKHSAVQQAALCLVDGLSSLPEVVPLLVGRGAMDAVDSLSEGPAGEGPEEQQGQGQDPLVRVLAERALVGMYLARQRGGGAASSA